MLFAFSCWLTLNAFAQHPLQENLKIDFNFLGNECSIPIASPSFEAFTARFECDQFNEKKTILEMGLKTTVPALIRLRETLFLSDWMFYQLIRKVANIVVPKKYNYSGYTICKWYLLKSTGYKPLLTCSDKKILLYINSTDTIYNIPIKLEKSGQYVCLNYHDYDYNMDFNKEEMRLIEGSYVDAGTAFSYKINTMPDFPESKIKTKNLAFKYKNTTEKFTLKIAPETKDYFTNYPVMEYRYQFTVPFSNTTYNSLIPQLKKRIEQFSINQGVEYLMFFVRDAFEFEADTEVFGREKRFSAEETLLSEKSDCEDRSALFFALVREIYDLPMVVLSYPSHVNVAVRLNNQPGDKVMYNNAAYTICEVTPQVRELRIGQQIKSISKQAPEIVYSYNPNSK